MPAPQRFPAKISPLASAITLLALSTAVQICIISGGTWIHWGRSTHLYSQMADRFLHGHLSMGDESGPDARKPDPDWEYDNIDPSLYHGRYY